MPKQVTSRQIAAHFAQSYLDKSADTDILKNFSALLEDRVSSLKKTNDRRCVRDVSSLLYSVRDLSGSCRDAAADIGFGDRKAANRDMDRASMRVREVGQMLVDIRQNHPQEYEKSCSRFVEQWRQMEFTKGASLLEQPEAEHEKQPASQPAPQPTL